MTEKLTASKAGRIMACHASANLELAIPNWVKPVEVRGGAAQAGTDVHKVIQDLLAIEHITPSKTTKFSAKDMLAVAEILQYVGELWSTRRFTVMSEVRMQATWLSTQPWTTPDLVLFTADEIHVLDTKWGRIPVSVHDNDQLKFYAVCVAMLAPKAKGVRVHILQPRADNMESVFITASELKQFMDDAIAAEAAILKGDITFGPSDHCTFCPANPHSRGQKGSPSCPAMMEVLGYTNKINEAEILSL